MSRPWTNYRLTPAKVITEWVSEGSVDFMNFAFWYRDRMKAQIDEFPDPSLRIAMRKVYNECCSSGFGPGVSDMEEAEKHLADNSGIWSDDNSRTYWLRKKQVNLYDVNRTSAQACVEFVHAVQERLDELAGVSVELESISKQISQMHLDGRREDGWKELGDHLKRAGKLAKLGSKYLWSANAKSYSKLVGSVLSKANIIHEGATIAVKFGRGDVTAGSLTVATGVVFVKKAVNAIPVFGKLYAKTIEWAVVTVPQFDQLMRDYWAARGTVQQTSLDQLIDEGTERVLRFLMKPVDDLQHLMSPGSGAGSSPQGNGGTRASGRKTQR